jgi:hypothetical protein
VTFHLDTYRAASDLIYRFPRSTGASALFITGLFGGVLLALLGAPLETAVWFAVAIIAFVTAVCVSHIGTGARYRYRRYENALSMSFLTCIGLVVGNSLVVLISNLSF